jgi:hypothetical protein
MEYIPVHIPAGSGAAADSHLRPEMNIRSRREVSAMDRINRGAFESWQTSTPLPGCEQGRPQYMTTAPLMARTDARQHYAAPTYKAGVGLGGNAGGYFNKYDVTSDPQNVARELDAAVYEPQGDRGVQESRRLAERQFSARWVPPKATTESIQARLKAGETLLPTLNDMSRVYR